MPRTQKAQKWFVSRQNYSSMGEPALVVEIAGGGLDYANPGMLAGHYDGEGEYTDPRDAADGAIRVANAWRRKSRTDAPDFDYGEWVIVRDDGEKPVYYSKEKGWVPLTQADVWDGENPGHDAGMPGGAVWEQKITIRTGHTGGFTMPFDEDSDEAAIAWAKAKYESLPKCPECGELMGDGRWGPSWMHHDDDERCCSEACADKRFANEEDEEG